jgi:hypothetical protein
MEAAIRRANKSHIPLQNARGGTASTKPGRAPLRLVEAARISLRPALTPPLLMLRLHFADNPLQKVIQPLCLAVDSKQAKIKAVRGKYPTKSLHFWFERPIGGMAGIEFYLPVVRKHQPIGPDVNSA